MDKPVPKHSFAHKMGRLTGWGRDEAIREIAGVDGVGETEAARRYDAAIKQRINRMVGQSRRQRLRQQRLLDARELALAIAYHHGRFFCATDLPIIANRAGWGFAIGVDSTGRAMRDILIPLEKQGLIAALHDEADKFVGYTLTEAGKLEFIG